jgi:O-antigen ligase
MFRSTSVRWWHILWMLTFVSALVFRIRMASDIASDPLDGWAVFRVAIDLSVAFVLLGRLALRRSHWLGSMFRGVLGALSVFGLICMVSTVWSVFPSWTLYKSVEILVDFALLATILETIDSINDFRVLFNWTWALYGLALLTVWMGAAIWPQEALYGEKFDVGTLGLRLQGVMPAFSSNDVGTFAAIIGLLALARLLPISEERFQRSWYGLLLVASAVTMVCSQTRTAITGFLGGVFLIMLLTRRRGMARLFTFVVTPLAGIVTMGGTVWSYLERGQSESQLASFSSRADWWSFAWQTYLERPLLGFGAYAGGRFAVLAKLGFGGTSTMHSDYLEILVGTSFWGMIPFLAALLGTWWLLLRFVRDSSSDPQQRQLAFESMAILALLTFRSVFMTMLTWHPPLHFLAIVGYGEFLRRRQNAWVPVTLNSRPVMANAPEELLSEVER